MPEAHVIEYEIAEDQAAAAADAVLGSLRPRPSQARLHRLVLQSLVYGIGAAVGITAGLWANQPWWFFVAPVLLIVLVAFLLALAGLTTPRRQHRQVAAALREAFRRLESPLIRWTITDEALAVESGRDAREFGWEDVRDVYLTGTFWVLALQNGPTMLLMADRLPDATARFLLTRARDAGATIRVAGPADPAAVDSERGQNG